MKQFILALALAASAFGQDGITCFPACNSNSIGPVAVTGTPSAGMVPTATSPTAATWQAPSSGGGTEHFTRTCPVRSAGVVYQNTSGFTMLVAAPGYSSYGRRVHRGLHWRHKQPPRPSCMRAPISPTGTPSQFSFWVPNNDDYEVTSLAGTPVSFNWCEYTLSNGTMTFSGDVHGSRAQTTNYQNTSGGAMFVTVIENGSTSQSCQGFSDSTTTPTTMIWSSIVQSTGLHDSDVGSQQLLVSRRRKCIDLGSMV